MSRNPLCTVYIGNLDEKVTERILYEILIQVGRVIDLYMPRDKDTNRHKGYAFAEFETEEIANYAVKLFSGLVRLHNKIVKFAISGQNKPAVVSNPAVSPSLNPSPPVRKPSSLGAIQDLNTSDHSEYTLPSIYGSRVSSRNYSIAPLYTQEFHGRVSNKSAGHGHFEYDWWVSGDPTKGVSRHVSNDHPISYQSYYG